MKKLLVRNKSTAKYFLVDNEDYDVLKTISWQLDSQRRDKGIFYAQVSRRNEGRTVKYKHTGGKVIKNTRMHRFLLGLSNRQDGYADHINGNTLDNRKSNLRIVDHSQSQWNRFKVNSKSGYKGVYMQDGHWFAQLKYKYKRVYLGKADTKEEGAALYDIAAKKLFGEYARTNAELFPSKAHLFRTTRSPRNI